MNDRLAQLNLSNYKPTQLEGKPIRIDNKNCTCGNRYSFIHTDIGEDAQGEVILACKTCSNEINIKTNNVNSILYPHNDVALHFILI